MSPLTFMGCVNVKGEGVRTWLLRWVIPEGPRYVSSSLKLMRCEMAQKYSAVDFQVVVPEEDRPTSSRDAVAVAWAHFNSLPDIVMFQHDWITIWAEPMGMDKVIADIADGILHAHERGQE